MKVLLLTVMMIFATSASAGLYKWVDDEGNVHYSQKRPRDKQFKRLKAPAPASSDSKPLYQLKQSDTKPNSTVAKETEKNAKIREKNCALAKKNLNNFQVYRRMRDKDGNITIINNEEREKQISNAKNAITNYCD